LQGTFVTLTNLSRPHDEDRIVAQHDLASARGRCTASDARPAPPRSSGKHAQHGIEALDRVPARRTGIELHAQIVLVPGVNDGDQLKPHARLGLRDTRASCHVGIVPLGYTQASKTTFDRSYNDARRRRRRCIAVHRALPEARASQERGQRRGSSPPTSSTATRIPEDLLDHLPPTEFYGDFELFEDGIGIVRSFVDDWESCRDDQLAAARALEALDARVMLVAGCAQKEFLSPLIEASPLAGRVLPLYVKNDYFGGNVDVTGLLCACDMAPAVRAEAERGAAAGRPYAFAAVPEVVFNADGVTLDGATFDEMEAQAGFPMYVVSCDASSYLPQIVAHCRDLRSGAQ
jgi:hypothetical protein